MKREQLEALNLEKEMIDKIMDIHGKDVEETKATATALESERDTYKTQLEEVQKQLKSFEGIVWYEIVAAVFLGILVAFVAMLGWDKLIKIWNDSKAPDNK